MSTLNVVSHLPQSEDMQKELSQTIASVHVQFVIAYLKELQYTEEQIKTLITKIEHKVNQ